MSSKKLNEEVKTVEARKEALAKHLDTYSSDIASESYDENVLVTNDGTYLVCTEEEAREYVKDDIQNCIDDLGLKDSFTPNFFQWILENALDDDFIKDYIRDVNIGVIEDLNEEENNEFGTQLIEDLYNLDYISDDDFELDEDGSVDHTRLKDSVDLEGLGEKYLDYLVENDSIDNILTEEELSELISRNEAYDLDTIVDEAISWDGVAHFIASYDGEETELDNDLFAYRID